uniref:Aminoglycoside phosphotransferase domain-containing protein n=1 Tax=Rhodopseudomonas palustris (strain BisA53) TaxID=316055 RepID=Q07JF5_RHOP5
MANALVDWLTQEMQTVLSRPQVVTRHAASRVSAGAAPAFTRQIAEQLVAEALQHGLSAGRQKIEHESLGGGNTADHVGRLHTSLPFAFKMDANSRKLAEEALTIRAIKNNKLLPDLFRDAWPTVFAVRTEAPYAYLMEYFPKDEGWVSLEDRLYPKSDGAPISQADVLRWTTRILDVLFSGLESSVDRRLLPNLEEDYVSRIKDRLESAAKRDDRFQSQHLEINGQRLKPWREYVAILDRRRDSILAMTPRFSTIVHGDPNPGNMMLNVTSAEVAVRLIDPKEWHWGDYLFDVAKLTHFLQHTGPIEKPAQGAPAPSVTYSKTGDGARFDHSYAIPLWTDRAVTMCLERAGQFAKQHDDTQWQMRYRLGMASNLLGLPIGRLTHKTNPKPDSAMILYCEGLIWLDLFCKHWEDA